MSGEARDPGGQESGERDLAVLLRDMEPRLDLRRFVFVAAPAEARARLLELAPIGYFEEPEGASAILEAGAAAEAGFAAAPRFALITLTVHSSLEAVGLTAAVATALAKGGIPANVVAAARHDHVFVPERQADAALARLRALQ